MKKFALIALTAAALALAALLLMADGRRGARILCAMPRQRGSSGAISNGWSPPPASSSAGGGGSPGGLPRLGVVRHLLVRIGDSVARGQLLAELEPASSTPADRSGRGGRLGAGRPRLRGGRSAAQAGAGAAQLLARSELDLTERASAVATEQLGRPWPISILPRPSSLRPDLRAHRRRGRLDLDRGGETVAASFASPTFVTLLDLDRLEVRAYVDETDIGRIRVGQKASFTVDTYPGQEFAGEVVAVYPQAEIRDNVVNLRHVVRFQAPPAHAAAEMTATVRIALETRRGVLAVPRRAVRRRREAVRTVRRGNRNEPTERRRARRGTARTPRRVSRAIRTVAVISGRSVWRGSLEADDR